MFCTKCGKEIKEGAKFCTACGFPIKDNAAFMKEAATEKNEEKQMPVGHKEKPKVVRNICIIVAVVFLLLFCGLFVYLLLNKHDVFEKTVSKSKKDEMVLLDDSELDDSTNDNSNMGFDDEFFDDALNESKAEIDNEEAVILYYEDADSTELESSESDSLDVNLDEFILPNSDSQFLKDSDLKGFSSEDCRLARNEIYARHGRIFKDVELQNYFNSKSWYNGTIKPEDFSESILNEYETANRDLIVAYEKQHNFR